MVVVVVTSFTLNAVWFTHTYCGSLAFAPVYAVSYVRVRSRTVVRPVVATVPVVFPRIPQNSPTQRRKTHANVRSLLYTPTPPLYSPNQPCTVLYRPNQLRTVPFKTFSILLKFLSYWDPAGFRLLIFLSGGSTPKFLQKIFSSPPTSKIPRWSFPGVNLGDIFGKIA